MKILPTPFLFFFPILFMLFSCGNSPQTDSDSQNQITIAPKDSIPSTIISASKSETIMLTNVNQKKMYNFGKPTQIMALPLSLLEISGLSYYPPKDQLLAVNDERGKLFFLNYSTGKVEKEYTFGRRGDYEGVEWMGEKCAVVKSNGDLYFFDFEKKEKSEIVKTKLNSSNDIEGLTYDVSQKHLLLVCKGNPNLGDSDKHKKTKNVYRYSLKKGKIKKKPVLSIQDEELENYVEAFSKKQDFSKKKIKKLKNRAKSFSPSGMAIHPQTKDYYFLSSVGKLLVIFDADKNLKEIIFLNPNIHRQPEGICFLPNGDLFISNEGKGLGAKLIKYQLQIH